MSEDNHDGEEPKIPKVLHFCHPENLVQLLEQLPGSRVQTVNDMGMGFVFHLKSKKPLNATITDYMVHNFEYDEDSGSVKIGETPIDLESCFKNCYDLPSEGAALQHGGSCDYKDRDYIGSSKFKDLKGMRLSKLWERVNNEDTPDEDFHVYFMTAILQEFLACSRESNTVDTSFARDLIPNSQNIKGLNWCSFFAKYLINAIVAYKKRVDEKKGQKGRLKCSGNLHILNLICADTLKFQGLEGPPEGHPRVKHITDEYLECLANYIGVKSRKSADHVHGESRVESRKSADHVHGESRVKPRARMNAKEAMAISDMTDDMITQVMGALKGFAKKLGGAEKPEEQPASKDAGHGVNQDLPVTGPKKKGTGKRKCRNLGDVQNLRRSARINTDISTGTKSNAPGKQRKSSRKLKKP